MKKALILGTLNPQADVVRYLKEAGWWVIGCGHRREGRAIELLDQFELVDLRDLDGLEALARAEKVDLIYSAGSETALPALAGVPPRLGLPALTRPDLVELTMNKVMLREFLNAHALGSVSFRKVSTESDLQGWNSFPAMVKPVDSAGQRGVFRADSFREIQAGLQRSLAFSPSRTVIVEEFLAGPEVSANAFILNAQVVFNEISDRLVVENYPGGIPLGHVFPSRTCTGEKLRETQRLVERCIQALGVENGPVYFQIKLTRSGPRIIEVMLRLDGCHLWRLIKTHCGVDLIAASLKLLSGEKIDGFSMKPGQGIAQLIFFLSPPRKIFHLADFPAPPEAVYFEYRYGEGEEIRPVNGFMEVVGYYITQTGE